MTDLISRRAAIKAIDDLPNCYNGYSDTYDKAYIIGTLEEVPSVEPKKFIEDYCRPRNLMVVGAECFRLFTEPKPEKWIEEPNCWYRCSNCGQHYPSIRGYMDYKYCPNCGARMVNDDEA